jgi:hypothetical protein
MQGGVYCDTRLGGKPRYILTDKPERLVQIPDEIRKCVVFVGYKTPDGLYRLGGTGFFVSKPTSRDDSLFVYLITAKHVIDEIRDRGADKVCMRMNLAAGDAVWVESDINDWIFHPDESECDVAILGCNLGRTFDHRTLPMSIFVTPEVMAARPIVVGSEIFLAGLFAHHHGQRRNIPIIRVGNISAMPGEEKVETSYGLIDAYLVEARSLGGISGAPVFVAVPVFRTEATADGGARIISVDDYFLLGLMHGHWDIDYRTEIGTDATEDIAAGVQAVNMGIAIVVPSSKILEVLNQPMVKRKEKEVEEEEKKGRLPKTDSALNDEPFTKDAFNDALKQASRKVSDGGSHEKKDR